MAALAAAQGSLPTELVEVRPGRTLAVHARVLHDSTHTLVFVHGSAASMLQWGAQIERFSADHSVVAIDAYGCGRSPKPQDWAAYSFEALTADLIAVLKRLVPPGSTPVLVAHSAGCSMAIAAVAAGLYAGAGRVAGLCLLGGYVEAPVPHPVFYLPVPVLRLIQPILSSGFESLALHADTRAGKTESHVALLSLSSQVNGSNQMHMCKAYYRQMDAPPPHEVARVGGAVPSLVISGEADGLIAPAKSLALAQLLASASGGPPAIHTVPRTSHQLMQEDPEAVNELIAAFVAGLRG